MVSSVEREKIRAKLTSDHFDLVVIGGGITGAGIALDAAARGLRTALVEKRDFASGTSSKSTKLIHGGLRYLKQLEVALVREVGQERATVHRLAPHLVRPEKMLLPLVEGGTYGKLATSAALWVYDLLAGVDGDDKRKMLSREDTLEREPLLRVDGLKGGGYYAEYRTDDARLTIENIKTAISQGALCLNYVEAKGFEYDDQHRITAVQCADHISGATFAIQSDYVVSAAGPWVDELRREDQSLRGKRLFLSKGVHIVVPHQRFPLQQAVYFDVPDGRMLFAIPRGRATYIGTTDTSYEGDPNRIPITQEEVQYLLEASNSMFPSVQLTLDDVESSWAGVRPLIYEEGKSASEMSRKDEIFESPSGLISIAGGKLTGYRRMSERVVDLVAERMEERGRTLSESRTKEIALVGGPFADARAVAAYELQIRQQLADQALPLARASYLVNNYGRQSEQIVREAAEQSATTPAERLAAAEASFCIQQELAYYPLDYYNRRSGRLYFDLPSIAPTLDAVLAVFGQLLHWDTSQVQRERERVLEAVNEVGNFAAASSTHLG